MMDIEDKIDKIDKIGNVAVGASSALGGVLLNSQIGQQTSGQISQNVGLMTVAVEPCLIIKKKKKYYPDDEHLEEVHGLPSNAYQNLGGCGDGLIIVKDIKLDKCSATDEEKEMIISLLKGGVYL